MWFTSGMTSTAALAHPLPAGATVWVKGHNDNGESAWVEGTVFSSFEGHYNVRYGKSNWKTYTTRQVRNAPPKPRASKAGTPAERVERTGETLPTVVKVLGVDDSGEYGNTSCPHCGALARYVTRFVLEDGTVAGAASSCFKLYPKR